MAHRERREHKTTFFLLSQILMSSSAGQKRTSPTCTTTPPYCSQPKVRISCAHCCVIVKCSPACIPAPPRNSLCFRSIFPGHPATYTCTVHSKCCCHVSKDSVCSVPEDPLRKRFLCYLHVCPSCCSSSLQCFMMMI